MDEANQKPQQYDFRWRYAPLADTLDAVLLDYVGHHPYLTKTEVCLQALRAFWLPLALQTAGKNDTDDLQRHGWEAIRLLSNQIEHLRAQLRIEPPHASPAAVVLNSGSYTPAPQLPVAVPKTQQAAILPAAPPKRTFDDSGFS